MTVSGRADAIMIADHNETKVFLITFFPEMHVEKVEIMVRNQCLVIGILKQSENCGFQEQFSGVVKMVKEDWGMQFNT